ncbi:uncharacterized protein LTR77_007897 [Saxophila tyrrhenica]|uniref:Uncharacterized protein n=1 Tax=Saxophila tyrrhenica TaxID=1690608 RepID=A0AAV9P6B9_9PEZI|nr:hypothetical protein LTR77_007897 [Saxophila tyrrhenica]
MRNVHKHYPLLHVAFGSVVRVHNKAIAVSCFIDDCRANAHGPFPVYFQGMRGLQIHVRQSHPGYEGLSLEQVARRCTKVELSAEDALLVERGRPPKTPIDYVFKDGMRVEGLRAKSVTVVEQAPPAKRRKVVEDDSDDSDDRKWLESP